ncbi:MAG: CHASE2 domain-containing protein [Vulcanimicrobiota bacterium]
MQKGNFLKNALPFIYLSLIAICACIVLQLLSVTRLIRNMELRTLDYRFMARNQGIFKAQNKETLVSPAIEIIAIDADSLEKIENPFFLWPSFITEVAEKLVKNEARVTGIDIVQEIPIDGFFPGHTKRMMGVLLSGKVVLTAFMENENKIRYPIAPLRAAAEGENIGLTTLTPDEDQVIRRQPVFLTDSSGNNLPSFTFLLVAKYYGAEIMPVDRHIYRIGENTVRTENGYMMINYAGPANTFRMTSFYEVLEKARKNDDEYFRNKFRNKIVLIGRIDRAGKDFFDVPFSASDMKMMSGVEICAHAINTVLKGSYLIPMGKITAVAVLLILCITASFLCYYLKPGLSTVILAGILIIYIVVAFYSFSYLGYMVNLVIPCLSIPFVYGATFVYRYYTVNRKLREVRNAFGKLVSPSVEEELWKGNIVVKPGKGEGKRVTILFSDINNFSPVCEKHSPSEIMEMLNRYFTDMVEIIFGNRGTIKQFVGDEIMAMYGAPEDEPHQALLAVKTAVEMIDMLKSRRDSGTQDGFFEVKIGIHTGDMVVGFIGSAGRMEYAAVGDSVNLAARLESLNKKLDTRILLSECTYNELMKESNEERARCLPDIEFKSLGAHELKGFEKKTLVYTVEKREKI